MIKVEIRAKINNFKEINKQLAEVGAAFIKKVIQADKIFEHPMFLDDNNMIIEGGIVPKIRTADKESVLEFKEIDRIKGGFEVTANLADIDIGINLLKRLGFNEAFTVSEIKEIYFYRDFVISLSDVEGLGFFIEIEKSVMMADDKDLAQMECLKVLNNISPALSVEDRKYEDLMRDIINEQKRR